VTKPPVLDIINRGATEMWEDNTSCIMMSENSTNRYRSRHVDVKVHFLRDSDLIRDGHIKLVKCAGTQNVSDALAKGDTKCDVRNCAFCVAGPSALRGGIGVAVFILTRNNITIT
jgi:hypothetical protein